MSVSEFRPLASDKHVSFYPLGITIGSRWYWVAGKNLIKGLFTTL